MCIQLYDHIPWTVRLAEALFVPTSFIAVHLYWPLSEYSTSLTTSKPKLGDALLLSILYLESFPSLVVMMTVEFPSLLVNVHSVWCSGKDRAVHWNTDMPLATINLSTGGTMMSGGPKNSS